MTASLQGKVAIITGAARGQGAAEAAEFIKQGAKVMLTDVLPGVLDLAKELGNNARGMIHDVSSEEEWEKVVAETVNAFGNVNVLVNNAGIFIPAPLVDTKAKDFIASFNVNQLGVFLGMKTVTPSMKAAGGGSIINISSGAGQRGYPEMISYLSTKWAVTGMTKATARELAPFGIRVNSVHPGLIKTPMIEGEGGETEWMKEIAKTVPMGRIGTTDDIVVQVVYLASDASTYMTGSEITLDGGTGL